MLDKLINKEMQLSGIQALSEIAYSIIFKKALDRKKSALLDICFIKSCAVKFLV